MPIEKVNLDELFPEKDNSKSGAIYEKHTPEPVKKREKREKLHGGIAPSTEALLVREKLSQLKKSGDIVYFSEYAFQVATNKAGGKFAVSRMDKDEKIRVDHFIRHQCEAIGISASLNWVRSKSGLIPRVTLK